MKTDLALKINDYDWEISDKRIVNLLSNFHYPKKVTQVKRKAKNGTITKTGSIPVCISKLQF